jgi:tetratricopeptide (TPR) repeat protein
MSVCVIVLCLGAGCRANLEVQKKQSEAIRNVGEAYLAERKYTDALREFLEAEKLYPDDPYLQNDLGLAYMAKKKPKIAVEHFKKALELKPDYAPARNNLGTAYMELQNWDAAITCFKAVADNLIYATPHYPLFNMGWSYYNKKEFPTAEKYYNETIQYYRDGFRKDDLYFKTMRNLGQTYVAMGSLSQAAKTVENAVKDEVVKNFPDLEIILYFDLARIYAASRQFDKAVEAYDMIQKIAPDTPLAKRAEKETQRLKP